MSTARERLANVSLGMQPEMASAGREAGGAAGWQLAKPTVEW